jgi:AraC-like DNA-binding protein
MRFTKYEGSFNCMQFSFFDIVNIIGFVNALIFAGVILRRRPHFTANKILAVILIILGLLCAKILLHSLNLWQISYFRYFPLGIDLFLQPLLYLYVLGLIEPQKMNKPLVLKHLYLPFAFLLYALIVYVATVFTTDLNLKVEIAKQLLYDEIKLIEDVLSVILGIYYGFLAYKQLEKYNRWTETYISNTAIPTYHWLLNLLILTAFILLFLGIMIISLQLHSSSFFPFQIFYFYLVFIIYVFGFFGFKHEDFKVSLDIISKKTEASSNTQLTSLFQKFEKWITAEKSYLEHDLSLNQCAENLDCSPQTLSESINLNHKNFRDYINHLRIEEFKIRVIKANLQKETIMGIAYECGFNSEASFYRIFKEKTGVTPKEFLKTPSNPPR